MYEKYKSENRLVDCTPLIEVAALAISEVDPAAFMMENMSEESFREMAINYLHNKEIAEAIQGVKEGFSAISDRTGHDGICKDGIFYEVKQNEYVKNSGFGLNLPFDRISIPNYEKFKRDRPIIKLFALSEGKLVYDIKIAFSDKMLEVYLEQVKRNKGGSVSFSFSTYKDSIIEVCDFNGYLADYKGTNPLVEYLYETTGVNWGLNDNYKRQLAFKQHLADIKKRYSVCANYAQVGREFTEVTGFTMDGKFISDNLSKG